MTEKKDGGIQSFKVSYGNADSAAAPELSSERGAFRIVVVSDLAPSSDYATAARPGLEPAPIDRYTFDEQLSRIAGSLAIEIADPFDDRAPKVRVDIRLGELRAFRPDGLAEQASVLRALLEARKTLMHVRDGRSSPSDAANTLRRILPREAWVDALLGGLVPGAVASAPAAPAASPPAAPPVASAPAAQKPTTKGGLDALLDQIELTPAAAAEPGPAPSPPPAAEPAIEEPNRAASLLGALLRNDAPKRVTSVGGAIQRVEQAFVATMERVLRHPEVRRLERAWRGLRLLVDRVDTKSGVEIDAIVAPREDVDRALRALVSSSDAVARGPVDLVVVDHEITHEEPALGALEAWGDVAALLRAPVLTNASTSLLGFPDIPSMLRSERRIESLDDGRAARIRGLQSRDASRWLALAINGFLVRAAYEPSTARFREIAFKEDPRDPGAHVFAGPALALAVVAAASWVRRGFASELTGPRYGIVENLPVRDVQAEGAHYAFPLEHLVSVETQQSVARAGMVLLGCAPNHDAAVIASAPTLFRGESTARGVDNEPTSLGDQLFIARVSHAVEQLAAAIPHGTPEEAIRDVCRVTLAELFRGAGRAAPEVDVKVRRESIEVTIQPHRFAGVTIGEFTLAAPLA